nr:hypothetical protein [Tanacetum cinerariifolium]
MRKTQERKTLKDYIGTKTMELKLLKTSRKYVKGLLMLVEDLMLLDKDLQKSNDPQQQQPSQTAKISMTLLNTLLETCDTLTKKVANLEQDKIAQAIEITMLKQRVKKRMHPNRGKISELDADEDVTLEEVDAEVTMDADVHGRLEES